MVHAHNQNNVKVTFVKILRIMKTEVKVCVSAALFAANKHTQSHTIASFAMKNNSAFFQIALNSKNTSYFSGE